MSKNALFYEVVIRALQKMKKRDNCTGTKIVPKSALLPTNRWQFRAQMR